MDYHGDCGADDGGGDGDGDDGGGDDDCWLLRWQ